MPPFAPRYGLDGPGWAAGLLGGGGAAVIVGAAGSATLGAGAGWRAAGAALALAAAVPLALGLSMLSYSYLGKLRLRDHLLGRRIWRGDETVLDVGAGRGLMAVGAALRVPRGRVIALDLWRAVDLTGNTPEALQRNAAEAGVADRIEIVTGDARRLDLADACVDVVTSVFCLHNIEPAADHDAACREIARVLKPGGMALIADFPSARACAAPLREAGLEVDGPFRAERIAWGPAGWLAAHRR